MDLQVVPEHRREAGLGADVYAYSMLLKEGGPDNLRRERDVQEFIHCHVT